MIIAAILTQVEAQGCQVETIRGFTEEPGSFTVFEFFVDDWIEWALKRFTEIDEAECKVVSNDIVANLNLRIDFENTAKKSLRDIDLIQEINDYLDDDIDTFNKLVLYLRRV